MTTSASIMKNEISERIKQRANRIKSIGFTRNRGKMLVWRGCLQKIERLEKTLQALNRVIDGVQTRGVVTKEDLSTIQRSASQLFGKGANLVFETKTPHVYKTLWSIKTQPRKDGCLVNKKNTI